MPPDTPQPDPAPNDEARRDLERISAQEQDLKLLADGMTACLQAACMPDDHAPDGGLARLLATLRPVFGFDAAFLVTRGADGVLTATGTTASRFAWTRWRDDGRFAGLAIGQLETVADISGLAEWDAQPAKARDGVRAALYLALREGRNPVILVCCHPRVDFFGARHLRLANQLAPVLAQALYLLDQARELRRCRVQLEHEIDGTEPAADDDFSLTPPPVAPAAAPTGAPMTQGWRRPTAGSPPAAPPVTQGWRRPPSLVITVPGDQPPAPPAALSALSAPAPVSAPASPAETSASAGTSTSRWSRRASQAMVLVVEDSPVNQLLAAGLLRKLGCTPLLAESGEAALALLAGNTVDCVLMDLQMPGIDGCETTRRLRSSGVRAGGGRHLPVLGVTSSTVPEEQSAALAAGMDEMLAKPLQLDVLAAKIRQWCV